MIRCPLCEFLNIEGVDVCDQSLQEDTRLVFAVHQMDLGGYRHLPVVGGAGELRGVISVRDILRYLTEKITISERTTG